MKYHFLIIDFLEKIMGWISTFLISILLFLTLPFICIYEMLNGISWNIKTFFIIKKDNKRIKQQKKQIKEYLEEIKRI